MATGPGRPRDPAVPELPLDAALPSAVLVKVCGLTDPLEARAAAVAGAAWIGLNFHPPSPRSIDDALAGRILAALPASCEPVGLFVNRPAVEVAERADRLGLRIVQLHGDEPPETAAALAAHGLRVVRAFRLGGPDAIAAMTRYAAACAELGRPLEALLVDAFVPGQAGGTGRTIPVEVLDRLADRAPDSPRLVLAGGLTPENVAAYVRRLRPWMVDVASGVEASPGRKDPVRVAAFIKAAGEALAALQPPAGNSSR